MEQAKPAKRPLLSCKSPPPSPPSSIVWKRGRRGENIAMNHVYDVESSGKQEHPVGQPAEKAGGGGIQTLFQYNLLDQTSVDNYVLSA